LKILIVVAYYPPEIGSAAHVYSDLARAFVQRGHEVDVITSYPREYNLNASDQSKEFPIDELLDGVDVHRVRHANVRDNIVMRGLEHFLLSGYYFRRYRELGKKFDVCLFYIPPLPLFSLAQKIKKADGTPSVLNYQDFHPQELTDVGVMKNPVLIRFMERLEQKSYANADFITVLSKGGIDYVVQRGADPRKVAHIYNSVSLDEMDRYLSRKDFKRAEGIENKFLISYAGILSPYQGIDNVLDAAKELTDHPEIIFYIAGDGSNKEHLDARVAEEAISNVKMVPFLPRDEYYNLVNSSDVSFISLDERMKAPCLPGKTINLMAARKPIIALVPEDCATARVIDEAGAGRVVKPGDVVLLRDTIIEFGQNPDMMQSMGNSGRTYLVDNMNLDKSITAYEGIFSKLTQPKEKT
jgi:colanic acid biosynthesis glycosyl transferase WcaI